MTTLRSLKNHSLFYASILLPLLLSALIYVLVPPSQQDNDALTIAKLAWFAGIMFVATNVLGFLYGSPHTADRRNLNDYAAAGWPKQAYLVVSYVSRGDNAEALRRAVRTSRDIMRNMRVNGSIEVVTDLPVRLRGVDKYVVPGAYRTKNGTMYKARALQYLLERRQERLARRRNVWVLHLDEESVITPEVVAGIAKFVVEHRGQPVIGQGEIQYNSYNYARSLLITAVDAIRTGDDLGRFRLQYKIFNKPLFGMHGSFVLLPRTLEDKIGFDLTQKGSITEDAYFALIAMARGYKFFWVDGYIREQSPFSVSALLKQRRRWISGLKSLVYDREIPLRSRLVLAVNMMLWRLAWIGPVVTLWNVTAGGSAVSPAMAIGAAILSGLVGSVYMVGAWRNASVSSLGYGHKLYVWIASMILVPVACLVEAVAIIYAAVRPVKTFQVVAK